MSLLLWLVTCRETTATIYDHDRKLTVLAQNPETLSVSLNPTLEYLDHNWGEKVGLRKRASKS